MKRFLVIAIVCAAVVLCAPRRSAAAQVQGGLKFGVNFAFIRGSDLIGFPVGSDSSWFLKFGLCGGGFVALPISRSVAVQAEALITAKGSRQIRPLFEDIEVYSLRITYFEIPVLARFAIRLNEMGSQVFFMAGPAFAFKLGGRLTRSGQVIDFNGVKPNDLGLVLSVGYTLRAKDTKLKGHTELRYTAGMSKVIEEGGTPLDIKNGVVSLIIGFGY